MFIMEKVNKVLFLILIVVFSCTKSTEEPPITYPSNYNTFVFESTDNTSSTSINKMVIQLNDNGSLKSITTTAISSPYRIVQSFFNSESLCPDSSLIEKTEVTGESNIITEYYQYNENKNISTIVRPMFYQASYLGNDTIKFIYNDQSQILNITEKLITVSQTIRTINREFIYNQHGDITKTISSSPDSNYNVIYTNEFEQYDNNINPINQLYQQCKFPIIPPPISFFPIEYTFMKSNPTEMKLQKFTTMLIEQNYIYNQFGFPIEVMSNWPTFKEKINYSTR